MPDWKLTDEQIVNTVNECYKSTGMLMRAAKAVPSDRAIALAAQKRLVEWLLEEGYLYSARDEGSQEEGLLLPMEDWQALCRELGEKDA